MRTINGYVSLSEIASASGRVPQLVTNYVRKLGLQPEFKTGFQPSHPAKKLLCIKEDESGPLLELLRAAPRNTGSGPRKGGGRRTARVSYSKSASKAGPAEVKEAVEAVVQKENFEALVKRLIAVCKQMNIQELVISDGKASFQILRDVTIEG
jgi:hypothetical protein